MRCLALFLVCSSWRRIESHFGALSHVSVQQLASPLHTPLRSKHQMPRGVKKENLPVKICVTCGRPFNWRKKWERCWDEVATCSTSCNRQRRLAKSASSSETSTRTCPMDSQRRSFSSTRSRAVESDDSSGSDTDGDDVPTTATPAVVAAPPCDIADLDAEVPDGGGAAKGSKRCDKCRVFADQLIRCRVDASRQWRMICDACWPSVSGGVTDGDDAHPYYQYGGLWKNRRKV